jgi:two-component system, NtrC family, nitrogen regulation sensor histidine kinase NtrY
MTTAEAATEMLDSPAAEPRSWSLRRLLAVVAVVLALLSAFLTFVVLTGLTPIVPTHEIVITFLGINSATILLLLSIIGAEVWQVVQARRRGRAASRLHVQIVALFSVIAVLPAVLVAAVANITLDRGLDRLFNTRTKAVIENSVVVAHAYVQENARQIAGDMIALANDLARARPLLDQDRDSFRRYFQSGAQARNLPVAMLLDKERNVLESASMGINQAFATPGPEFLTNVTEDKPEVAVYENYVAAVIRLRAYDDTFLYVARLIDPRVVSRLQLTQEGAAEFAELESRRLGIQVAFALMFTVIALTLLTSSVLIGLNFSNWLVAPIRRLMAAANLVSTGDLKVQVPVNKSEGDLAKLGETFNKMTSELRTQRDDLVRASDVIDSRRRFIEAVLSSASAGIIGVDEESKIAVLNRSAEKLIGHPESEALSRPLSEIVPELNEMMAHAREGMQRLVQGQITISRGGKDRTLSVRVSAEQSGHTQDSYIITLDDITELVSAQRTSAWADVARRIAHEIKNPLTPIQLSAERIRRKYGKVIVEDRTVFDQCTDTIVRQVDDIRRMVDEFSRFARMPKPVIENEDVADTVRQVVFLMRVGHPDIDIDSEIKEDPMPARFDRRLISQGLQNIIKNASEAIAAVPPAELGKGRIDVRAARDGDDIVVDVIDNGIGLPKESRSRLLEPYVTTREKGTGLGLAIVGRILEDHGGRIELNDASQIIPGQRGAWLRLRFAAAAAPAATGAGVASPEATAAAK